MLTAIGSPPPPSSRSASVAAQTQAVQEAGDGEAEAEQLANLTPDTLVRVPVVSGARTTDQQQEQQNAGDD